MLQPSNNDSPSIVLAVSSLVGGIRLRPEARQRTDSCGKQSEYKSDTALKDRPRPLCDKQAPLLPSAAATIFVTGIPIHPTRHWTKKAGSRISCVRDQGSSVRRAPLRFCHPSCHFIVSPFFLGREGKSPRRSFLSAFL